ncbi:unnamed protein product [Ectocarpus sp. 4 AP-2014]
MQVSEKMARRSPWSKLLAFALLAVSGASGNDDGGTPGVCTFVDTIAGVEKEEMQDRSSVRTKDGVPIAFENMEYYVRMLTLFGNAQTDFYFSPPSAVIDGTASSLTIEVSALVPTEGSGGVWTVGIGTSGGGDGNDTLYTVGDLAPANNTDWTTIYLTVPLTADQATGSLASYMDDNNEMLITLSCSQPGSTQVVFVDYMSITAATGGSFAAMTPVSSSTGRCTYVDTVTGLEKEMLQDRVSVQAGDDVPVSFENMASYVRMLTVFGNAQTDFYFSPPSSVADGTAKSIVVGASALVPTEGSGGVWSVGVSSIDADGNSTLHTVGDFAAAGSEDWTPVTLTMPVTADVADYVDDNNEMLLTVSCSEPGTTQALFIDLMEVSAFDGDDLGEYSYSFDYSAMAVEGHYEQNADETDEEDEVGVQADAASAPSVIVSGSFFLSAAATVLAVSLAGPLLAGL